VLFHDLHREKVSGEKVLEVKDIKAKDNRGLTVLNGVSFSLRAGEILGVAGVEGNGQSELVEVLTGLRNLEDGDYFINGKKITDVNPSNMRNLGISHVPEDRLTMGLSKEASLWENLLMGLQHKKPFVVKKIHLNKKKIFERTDNLIKEYDIRAIDRYMKVKKLSGGNMQKVVIAREFSFDSPILIIAQPTRGVDVGATEFIHNQIMRKRNEGAAILLVSAELDEIMRLSDRIITIYEGSITGEFKNKEVTKQTLGLYMTGKQNKLKGSEDN
ncbi:MAG: ATP-binding cassette domain-containing protein, partial [Deferribacterales bacterium]|nr:ATP-binding cassette domain-containing protein [Deferribacterales bacterium]